MKKLGNYRLGIDLANKENTYDLKDESAIKTIGGKGILKKNVKRLGSYGENSNACVLKGVGRKIKEFIMNQLKEDILEHLVSNQVDAWFKSQEECAVEDVVSENLTEK